MIRRIIAWCGLCLPGLLAAGEPPAPAEARCEAAEHRQFDFWIGEWAVSENGAPAGRNRIERVAGGCALAEHWTGASGTLGRSLNAWDAERQRWHQTWVDSGGTVLYLDGGLVDGAMVMEGTRPGEDGIPVRHRITWTPAPDGSVRQLWEARPRGGAWAVLFDGRYERAAPP